MRTYYRSLENSEEGLKEREHQQGMRSKNEESKLDHSEQFLLALKRLWNSNIMFFPEIDGADRQEVCRQKIRLGRSADDNFGDVEDLREEEECKQE